MLKGEIELTYQDGDFSACFRRSRKMLPGKQGKIIRQIIREDRMSFDELKRKIRRELGRRLPTWS